MVVSTAYRGGSRRAFLDFAAPDGAITPIASNANLVRAITNNVCDGAKTANVEISAAVTVGH